MEVKRIYIERKDQYTNQSDELLKDIKQFLGIPQVEKIKILIRYDIENISKTNAPLTAQSYQKALAVFSEPFLDTVYEDYVPVQGNERVFHVELNPGQFDQRADSLAHCIGLVSPEEKVIVQSATTYIITGVISDDDFNRIKAYVINPVDLREAGADKPKSLVNDFEAAEDVMIYHGFREKGGEELKAFYDSLALAMTFNDFLHIHKYYCEEEKRDPTVTEIRVLDTYWSDHCRHTTFQTELTDIEFGQGFFRTPIEASYQNYLSAHQELFEDRDDKFVCLMDLA